MSSGKITELAGTTGWLVGWLIGYVVSMHLVAYIVSAIPAL